MQSPRRPQLPVVGFPLVTPFRSGKSNCSSAISATPCFPSAAPIRGRRSVRRSSPDTFFCRCLIILGAGVTIRISSFSPSPPYLLSFGLLLPFPQSRSIYEWSSYLLRPKRFLSGCGIVCCIPSKCESFLLRVVCLCRPSRLFSLFFATQKPQCINSCTSGMAAAGRGTLLLFRSSFFVGIIDSCSLLQLDVKSYRICLWAVLSVCVPWFIGMFYKRPVLTWRIFPTFGCGFAVPFSAPMSPRCSYWYFLFLQVSSPAISPPIFHPRQWMIAKAQASRPSFFALLLEA